MEVVQWVVQLTADFDSTATNDEAVALLELLSRSDDLFYEVSWTILHFIESAPGWPIWPALLGTSGEYADILRIRLKNAGLMPPRATADTKE
jgi:hypothetical protein